MTGVFILIVIAACVVVSLCINAIVEHWDEDDEPDEWTEP